MTDLTKTIEANCEELARSLAAIDEKHGHKKATTAMLLYNCIALLGMLKRHDVDDFIIAMVKRQFRAMSTALCNAAGLDESEITAIADGIYEQCALLTADVVEAEKQTDTEKK